MSFFKKCAKVFFFISLLLCLSLFAIFTVLNFTVSDSYKLQKGEDLVIDSKIPVTAESNDCEDKKYSVDLKLFGVIPYQSVNVEVVDEMSVAVLGQPFGMKIYTDGVLVVDTSDVQTKSGRANPAKQSGIKVGDYIRSVDNIEISTNEQLAQIVETSGGKKLNFEVVRDNKTFNTVVCPVKGSKDYVYHIGIWVRDSSAGVGTLTFYSPKDKIICGLGHGISDDDTDELLSLSSGQMVEADIISVKRGVKGNAGELHGRFESNVLGDIALNSNNGVYGYTDSLIDCSNLIKVAAKQEIVNGAAQILCTVNGKKPKLYSCTVKRHSNKLFGGEENLTVTVTDGNLLNATGGIVQGMSGSPIIQNGKLIGAVTHVLVDDPTTGYAIFAENMLETAQGVANENKLKDAS